MTYRVRTTVAALSLLLCVLSAGACAVSYLWLDLLVDRFPVELFSPPPD
jgi:hypothetical protein